jgi:hypothetical protein
MDRAFFWLLVAGKGRLSVNGYRLMGRDGYWLLVISYQIVVETGVAGCWLLVQKIKTKSLMGKCF